MHKIFFCIIMLFTNVCFAETSLQQEVVDSLTNNNDPLVRYASVSSETENVNQPEKIIIADNIEVQIIPEKTVITNAYYQQEKKELLGDEIIAEKQLNFFDASVVDLAEKTNQDCNFLIMEMTSLFGMLGSALIKI